MLIYKWLFEEKGLRRDRRPCCRRRWSSCRPSSNSEGTWSERKERQTRDTPKKGKEKNKDEEEREGGRERGRKGEENSTASF